MIHWNVMGRDHRSPSRDLNVTVLREAKTMTERTTQVLLVIISVLLLAQFWKSVPQLPAAQAEETASAPAVLRAQAIELVDRQGKVKVQLQVAEDGGGLLRMRGAEGTVRVKLGATPDGSGLLLFDQRVEPAVWLAVDKNGTRVTLAEEGKENRVIEP
jgi:hypothetical protein